MPYSRGDVVLVPFPFTDLSGQKKRPALVVSADTYNSAQRDVVLAQISSQVPAVPRSDEYVIIDWLGAGLNFPSVVRAKLFTIESSMVVQTLGQLPRSEMLLVDDLLRTVLAL